MKKRDTDELINIGKIGSSVGLRGEVRATLYSPDSGKVLLLKHAGKTAGAAGSSVRELEAKCTGVRLQKDRPVIKLEGITDRTMADELRGFEDGLRERAMRDEDDIEHASLPGFPCAWRCVRIRNEL